MVQYRTAERGDTVFALDVAEAIGRHAAAPAHIEKDSDKEDLTPAARAIASSPLRIEDLVTSPDGMKLAFTTNAINQRQEKYEDVEICVFELGAQSSLGNDQKVITTPRQLTHNQAVENKIHWSNDSRHILFTVEVGDVAGPYRDLQPHLYSVDDQTGAVEQWRKLPRHHRSLRRVSQRNPNFRPRRHRSSALLGDETGGQTSSAEHLARHLRTNLHRATLFETSFPLYRPG